MSDQSERIGAEEELAAGLTAFALGELNEEAQAALAARLALRLSSGESTDVIAGTSSSADVEQLAIALRQADRTGALPEPSAALRQLLESKLEDDEAVVDLKEPRLRSKRRRRIGIALATGLSLLLVAIPVRQFSMTKNSRALKAEIAQLQAANERLRAEATRADARLGSGRTARRPATPFESEGDTVTLAVTPRIIIGEEEQARLGVTTRPAQSSKADDETRPTPTMKYVAPPIWKGKKNTSTPASSYLSDDIQYFDPGPEFKQSREAAALEADEVSLFAQSRGTDNSKSLHFSHEVANFRRAYGVVPSDGTSQWTAGRTEGVAGEQYSPIAENRLTSVSDEPLSTFSIDVDTASYANARRFLSQNQLPPANAIRIEEFINYFSYDYPAPTEGEPFSVNLEVAQCPWQPAHQLVRVGLQAKEVPQEQRPSSNIVFLLDVSGSMQDANKLPLLKQAMKLLTDQLTERDRVSIVTYAGNAGLALDTTNGERKQTIRDAIDALNASGSTNGGAGIQLAYEKATASLIKQGANRVILATDGDLNVGVTDDDALIELIQQKAASGVFLTVLGFGEGNLKDGKLEKLADNGNGMYAYIDSLREARKVLVEQVSGSLVTIAKDVKIKVEFNPAEVAAYRLLGYENRLMSAPDFDNDAKDAGEIGAGHTVTALYEIVPTKIREQPASTTTSLKYQRTAVPIEPPKELTAAAKSGELLTLFLRFKQPDANESTLSEFTLENKQRAFDDASPDFRFAAAVASFGMVLRDSEFRGNASLADVEQIARSAIGGDPQGHRTELLDLVRKASTLQPQGR